MGAVNEPRGIIDPERNPFVYPSWVEQGYALTPGRKEELARLFGKTIQEIMDGEENTSRYPAFLGIRWGVAAIRNGRLVQISQL
jgi:hypothetical protein